MHRKSALCIQRQEVYFLKYSMLFILLLFFIKLNYLIIKLSFLSIFPQINWTRNATRDEHEGTFTEQRPFGSDSEIDSHPWIEWGVIWMEMKTVVFCPGLMLLFAWLSPSQALYFHIGETEKKCFIEEIPDETMVIGTSIVKSALCDRLALSASWFVHLVYLPVE